ncbi:hypothetical protein [Dongia sp.]|uniref:hypothetical protein n=1 Tax=Dongia sp. TaxID=1977262 RepID=UPI003753C843
MNLLNLARCGFIGIIALLAAACAQPITTTSATSSGSDDNGANCGGTPINKESCINNQNRMP